MNIRVALLSAALMLSYTTTASAVEHAVVGSSTITVASGATFTINISLDNVSVNAVAGLTGVISGLNAVGGTVVGGQASLENFASFCGAPFPAATPDCFGAIPTLTNTNYDPNDLSAAALVGPAAYMPGDDTVTTIAALHGPGSTSPNAGAFDPGVAGVIGVFDPNDISIDLTATASGTIAVDLAFAEAGMTTDLTPLMITINVPEPGTMASSAVALSTILAVVGIRRREA